jgi:hypothetical protein
LAFIAILIFSRNQPRNNEKLNEFWLSIPEVVASSETIKMQREKRSFPVDENLIFPLH